MNAWAVPGYAEALELGSGASGRVVRAVHEPTGVPVAVKYLSDSLRTRPGFVHGFRAEAELLGSLSSPHVAGLYEYIEATNGAAIVMELVEGVSLRTLLARRGPLTPEAALVVLKGSLLGLADAHRVGVVHRDYKPENVLVEPDGGSKLVDFGIAVDAGVRAGVAGTPSYMAPEQWTGAPASPAGDVYAATATFFECLTGRRPYTGDNMAELALRHVEGPVPVEEVPEEVRPLVGRGLAKSPSERPSDAAAFVEDLERIAVGAYGPDWEERGRGRLAALVALLLFLRPSAREAPHPGTDTARTVLSQGTGPGRLRPWRPTWPGVLVSAVAVLVALLAQGLGGKDGAGVATGQAAEVLATTTATPDGSSTSGPVSPSPPGGSPSSDSATPSGGTNDASTTPSASLTPSTAPVPTTSNGGTPAEEPSAPPSSSGTTASPSPPPRTGVKDVAIAEFRQTGTSTGTASITVTTDGTGPVSVTIGWFSGDASGQPGTSDGAADVRRLSGSTQYGFTVQHSFAGTGCYWTVQVTTDPVAGGEASQQLLTRRCDIR
ncbi:protein kinase domain-containing protein [Streptomyces sp. NBC_01334]|uniref:protein kinase domain-containing protein n=1 Tax=Streptomyces sp. NBC_01334 TaxID=2903827 RepID=UPI002E0D7293|nr:protein kinase [Streptomyces sp. NBC_01334]